MKLSTKVQELTDLLTPSVVACDVSLWGIEFVPQGNKSLLRIYIEAPEEARAQGAQVTIDDCATVNHQVAGVLDVHDPIAGEYLLEVSSPGFDRPLFSKDQLAQYVGSRVFLRLIQPQDGTRRKLSGKLLEVTDVHVVLAASKADALDEDTKVALDNIDKAHLIYQE